MNSQRCSRENSKGFRDWVKSCANCQDKPPEHLKQKFWKNSFKCFLRLEVPPARESRVELRNFRYDYRDWTSTCEQVTTSSREKPKNPDFEKFSKYFSWLGHWPARELRKRTIWAHDWGHATGLTRDQVARTGQHCFWKFDTFCKNKILSKNN